MVRVSATRQSVRSVAAASTTLVRFDALHATLLGAHILTEVVGHFDRADFVSIGTHGSPSCTTSLGFACCSEEDGEEQGSDGELHSCVVY